MHSLKNIKQVGTDTKRIVIFHDQFMVLGGAEKLVLILAREHGATIYTTSINRKVIVHAGFEDITVKSIGVPARSFPTSATRKLFSDCDVSNEYDFFIFSGTHSLAAAKNHSPNLWYCHTPDRGLYNYGLHSNLPYGYVALRSLKDWLIAKGMLSTFMYAWIVHAFVYVPTILLFNKQSSSLKKISIFKKMKMILSLSDYHYSKESDKLAVSDIESIVANSSNIQTRVRNVYKREASIVYPPVTYSRYTNRPAEDFWLSVNRIVPEKRVELQIEAWRLMPDKKLIIIGGYSPDWKSYAKNLQQDLPPNVIMLGNVDDSALIEYYSKCRGFITTAYDEDFGMTAVEAMASGKPVIAPYKGGYRESVLHNKTGIIIDRIDPKKIQNAVNFLDVDCESYKDACRKRAQMFDTAIFAEEIRQKIIC